MQIDLQILSIAEDTRNFNMIKDTVLKELRESNAITEEQQKEFTENWSIVIFNKSWIARLKDKITGNSGYEAHFVNLTP